MTEVLNKGLDFLSYRKRDTKKLLTFFSQIFRKTFCYSFEKLYYNLDDCCQPLNIMLNLQNTNKTSALDVACISNIILYYQ